MTTKIKNASKKSLRRSFRRLRRPPIRRNDTQPPVTSTIDQPVIDGTRHKPPEFLEDEIKVKQGTCQFKVSFHSITFEIFKKNNHIFRKKIIQNSKE